MNIDYELLSKRLNEYGNYILNCIKNDYNLSLTPEQLQTIETLLKEDFIVVEKPSQEDIEFFSRQAGITDAKDYSPEYVPSAHGGRTKNDNKIHIYPYTKSFSDCQSTNELIQSCIDSIVVHEIFHYFIRPNLSDEEMSIKEEFGHFLTEGLVEHYTEEFAKKHNLGNPQSNYGNNVSFAKRLIASFPDTLTQTQIDRIIFTHNQDELLKVSKQGQILYEEYVDDIQFKQELSSFITTMALDMGMHKDDDELRKIIRHYRNIPNIDTIFTDLSQQITQIFKNDDLKRGGYLMKLQSLISNRKLKKEMSQYSTEMKTFLPIEEQIKKLKSSGKSLDEIKTTLGKDSYILDYVPPVLYHGSPESLDVIKAHESTQKGSYVYATDNPIHALFFAIFRNSSVARAHIDEYIDDNGDYKVKFHIDERIAGALDKIITNQNITIHICNGSQFFKPEGAAYISREWLSKNGQDITPVDKITINVKHFFELLEKNGLVEYDRYDKSKDWQTILDLLGQNYPYGLGTAIGENIQEFDSMYDEFISANFPDQLEFSKQFRAYIKSIMDTDYKLTNPNMTIEEENNYKLNLIRKKADSFLVAQKNETGQIKWTIDMDKINAFLRDNPQLEESGISL